MKINSKENRFTSMLRSKKFKLSEENKGDCEAGKDFVQKDTKSINHKGKYR